MKQILLILIGLSIFAFAEFSRSDKVITDSITGLQWQDDADAKNIRKTWQEAIEYCENKVSLEGYDDWRLPNINELESLVDDSRYDPAIDTTFFKNVAFGYYWSSTTYSFNTDTAWIVYFNYGRQDTGSKDNRHSVRCVRSEK